MTTSKQVLTELEILSANGVVIPVKARSLAKRLHDGEYNHLSIPEIAELVIQLCETIRTKPQHVKEWKVLIDNNVIDNVYFDSTLDAQKVRHKLIREDSYPIEIRVEEQV